MKNRTAPIVVASMCLFATDSALGQSRDAIEIEATAISWVDNDYDTELDGPDQSSRVVRLTLWPGTHKQEKKGMATQCTIVRGGSEQKEARMTYRAKMDTVQHDESYEAIIVKDWTIIIPPKVLAIKRDSMIMAGDTYIRSLVLDILPGQKPSPLQQKGIVFRADSVAINMAPERRLLVRLGFNDLIWRTDETAVLRSRPYGDFRSVGISNEALDRTYGGWQLWGETVSGQLLKFKYTVDPNGNLALDEEHLGAFRQDGKRDSPVVVTYSYKNSKTGIERDSTEVFKEFIVTIKPPIDPKPIMLKQEMISESADMLHNVVLTFPDSLAPYMEGKKAFPELTLADKDGHIGDWYLVDTVKVHGVKHYRVMLLKTEGFHLESGAIVYRAHQINDNLGFPGIPQEFVRWRTPDSFIVRPRMVE